MAGSLRASILYFNLRPLCSGGGGSRRGAGRLFMAEIPARARRVLLARPNLHPGRVLAALAAHIGWRRIRPYKFACARRINGNGNCFCWLPFGGSARRRSARCTCVAPPSGRRTRPEKAPVRPPVPYWRRRRRRRRRRQLEPRARSIVSRVIQIASSHSSSQLGARATSANR